MADTPDVREAAAQVLPIIRRAIADPGAFLPRHRVGEETVAAWGARAVLYALAAADWGLAPPGSVVVQLPEPVITGRVCGCGIAPDGAPGAAGCCAECMAPAMASVDSIVDIDVEFGSIHDGSGESFTPDAAERRAAALLSAARFARQYPASWTEEDQRVIGILRAAAREATPAPEPGGQR